MEIILEFEEDSQSIQQVSVWRDIFQFNQLLMKKKKRKRKERNYLFRFLTVFWHDTFSNFNLSRKPNYKVFRKYIWYSISCKEYKLRTKTITFIHVIMFYSSLGSIVIGSKFSHDPRRNIQFFISF